MIDIGPHLSPVDLEGDLSDVASRHLEACPRCRVRARLLTENAELAGPSGPDRRLWSFAETQPLPT